MFDWSAFICATTPVYPLCVVVEAKPLYWSALMPVLRNESSKA